MPTAHAPDPNDAAAQFYDIVYAGIITPERTAQEIAFITSRIPKGAILDIGCGTGRHLLPLARLGYAMTGIDTSARMLDALRSKRRGEQVRIIHGSIAGHALAREFDGAICFWNAFSEIARTEEEARSALGAIFRSLREGGALIMQQANPEHLTREPMAYAAMKDGKTYEVTFEFSSYDPGTRTTVSKEVIAVREGPALLEKAESTLVQRWWTREELEQLCAEAGFRGIAWHDGQGNQSYNAPEMILVATR